jgi:hypothetical protein
MSEDEGAFDSAEKFIEISGTNISVLEADWLDECRCLHGYMSYPSEPRVLRWGSNSTSAMEKLAEENPPCCA